MKTKIGSAYLGSSQNTTKEKVQQFENREESDKEEPGSVTRFQKNLNLNLPEIKTG